MTTCPHCRSAAPEASASCPVCGGPLRPGALLADEALPAGTALQEGHYVLAHTLGQGGFGITYAGRDNQLGRAVAIKELFPTGCARRELAVMPTQQMGLDDFGQVKLRFLEESRTLARFSHPGIVQVYGAFEENNTAYMVMEYLEGEPLSQKLRDSGSLPEAEAVAIAKKLGAALEAVHAVNLIHRDIKPENIILARDGRIVLIDFGSARGFAAGSRSMTSVFTPGYAPLEQYSKQAKFGTYTDIYALGATLYHCLTGQIPPDATDRATGVELKSPTLLNPDLSREVSDAVLWAMQMKIDHRPAQVRYFLDVLGRKTFAQQAASRTAAVQAIPFPAGGETAHPATRTNGFLSGASPDQAYAALLRAFREFRVAALQCDPGNHVVSGSFLAANARSGQMLRGRALKLPHGTQILLECTPTDLVVVLPPEGTRESQRILRLVAAHLAEVNYEMPPPIPPVEPTMPPVNLATGSGHGSLSASLPSRLDTFNMGAFLLGPIWCIANRACVGILWLIPCVGWIVAAVWAGVNGNRWAWENRKWKSVEEFERVQRLWSLAGIVAWIAAFIGYGHFFF